MGRMGPGNRGPRSLPGPSPSANSAGNWKGDPLGPQVAAPSDHPSKKQTRRVPRRRSVRIVSVRARGHSCPQQLSNDQPVRCGQQCSRAAPDARSNELVIMKRMVIFGLAVAVLWTAEDWWLNSWQTDLSSRLALNQLNGGGGAARELRSFQWRKDRIHLVSALAVLATAGVLWAAPARRLARRITAAWARKSSAKHLRDAAPL